MELLILVGLWVCCGFACASIAEGKNRNSQTWFFLGVLLGIFAVVIVSILPSLS
jgi:heme/copper-type cytochrome/quinol oxidase subunit 3